MERARQKVRVLPRVSWFFSSSSPFASACLPIERGFSTSSSSRSHSHPSSLIFPQPKIRPASRRLTTSSNDDLSSSTPSPTPQTTPNNVEKTPPATQAEQKPVFTLNPTEPPTPKVLFEWFHRTDVPSTGPSVRIMTYNVLSSTISDSVADISYRRVPKDKIAWGWRGPRMLEQIAEYNPDILCMQEVDTYASFFEPELTKMGYAGAFQQRGGSNADGCAVFWRSSKFRAPEGAVIYNFNQEPLTSGMLPRVKRGFRRHNIALFQLLEHVEPTPGYPSTLMVANTHLYWDPNFEGVKILQALRLMTEIKACKQKWGVNTPSVLCGDFNSFPDSNVFSIIAEGKLVSKTPPQPLQTYPKIISTLLPRIPTMKSSYEHLRHPNSNVSNGFIGCLDYIFYSPPHFDVRSLLHAKIESDANFPDTFQPSDHLPLVAELVLRQGSK